MTPSCPRRRAASWPSARPAASGRCGSRPSAHAAEEAVEDPLEGTRSDVATDVPVPTPPFWGSRVVKGIALAEYASLLDERATFLGQWGLKGAPRRQGPELRGAGRDRGPAAAAVLAGPVPDRGRAGGGRGLRLLPVRQRGQRPDRPRRGRRRDASPVRRSRASAGTGGCAWPTSSAPRESGRDRRGGLPRRHHGRSGSPSSPTSCSRRTTTATTSRCTGSRCS